MYEQKGERCWMEKSVSVSWGILIMAKIGGRVFTKKLKFHEKGIDNILSDFFAKTSGHPDHIFLFAIN
jgi:hypothetical protein